jgi:formate C-acetyltransferase
MSRNNALPDPDILMGLGEAFAAGYFELPDASPLRRWARAVRRRFEHRAIPAYAGTRLYPAGAHTQARENLLLSPSYSFTWSYNAAALQTCLATADERTRETLLALDRAMVEQQKQLDCIRTVHTVGGRGYTHSIPNYGRVLREGLARYDDRIREKLAAASAVGDGERQSLCEGLLDVLTGIRAWHGRLTAALAATTCEETAPDAHRRRLLACLAHVPFRPARTFAEAITAYNLVYYLDDCDNPGRVDQELIGFYRRDLAEGLITYEEAEACVHELWQNTDLNSGWSATIGGSTPNGDPAYNELTLICLRAARGMRRPNLQLRIRRDMPDTVWEEALETLSTGTGLPALHNEEEFRRSLREARLGLREADFALLNGGGCTETMVHGCSNVGSLDAGLHLPLVLERTLRQHLPDCASFAELLTAFGTDLHLAIAEIVRDVNRDQEMKARLRPQPMRSLLIDDCIENGMEYNAGGARYNWSVVNVAGLANVVDSLAAVREAVFEKAFVSGPDLLAALAADFAESEPLRRRLERCPRFGNDQPAVDQLAAQIAALVCRELLAHAPWRGGRFLGSCLMFVTYAAAGAQLGATPDGRRRGAPIADSAGPMQGRDRKGPTAMIKSVAALPHYLAPGTLVVNARFSREMFDTPEQRDQLRALVRSYFDLGGMQMQINVIDQEMLRRACEKPEDYPDLIVRLGGYSEYFIRLSPELRRSVLERTEHRL